MRWEKLPAQETPVVRLDLTKTEVSQLHVAVATITGEQLTQAGVGGGSNTCPKLWTILFDIEKGLK